MEELRREVMETINKLNQAWIDAENEAFEKGEKVDTTKVMSELSKQMVLLDEKFVHAKIRIEKGKKKGWF